MKLKIESVETGDVFNMRVVDSIETLKYELSFLCPIPPEEQILLSGPPYRVFDGKQKKGSSLDDKRIFLFDRRILTDDSIVPRKTKLLPQDIMKPEILKGSLMETSQALRGRSSAFIPLSILEYERYFQEQLNRSQMYESFVKDVLSSCKKCANQHKIQLDGIRAAIDNLKETFGSASKQHILLEAKLAEQQSTNNTLIQNFEDNLLKLKEYPLHPSIVEEFEKSKSSSTTSIESSTETIRTLYDCIPIEREQQYLKQCAETYQKVEEAFERARRYYGIVRDGVQELEEPAVDFELLDNLINSLTNEEVAQAAIMSELRSHFQYVYDFILSVEHENHSNNAESASNFILENIDNIVAELDRRKLSYENQRPLYQMEQRARMVKEIKAQLERSQDKLVQGIYSVLRKIAGLQTDIQYKLKRDNDWMKKWTATRGDYFDHLEKVSNLPGVYSQFLREIVRRRAFNTIFAQEIAATEAKISRMRAEETKYREIFIQEYGNHLPPIFLELFQSLKEKPPSYGYITSPLQQLPSINYEDLQPEQGTSLGKEIANLVSSTDSMAATTSENPYTSKLQISEEKSEKYFQDKCARLEYENLQLLELTRSLRDHIDQYNQVQQSKVERPPFSDKLIQTDVIEEQKVIENLQPADIKQVSEVIEGTTTLVNTTESLVTTEQTKIEETKAVIPMSSISEHAMINELIDEIARTTQNSIERTTEDTDYHSPNQSQIEFSEYPTQHTGDRLLTESALDTRTGDGSLKDMTEGYLNIKTKLLADPVVVNLLKELQDTGDQDDSAEVFLSAFSSDRTVIIDNQPHNVGTVVKEAVDIVYKLASRVQQKLRYPTISFIDFRRGDVALFLPTQSDRTIWSAFAAKGKAPHRYLSQSSLESFLRTSRGPEKRQYILGTVVFIEQKEADAENSKKFKIPEGTMYYIFDVEVLNLNLFVDTNLSERGSTTGSYSKLMSRSISASTSASRVSFSETNSSNSSSKSQGSRNDNT